MRDRTNKTMSTLRQSNALLLHSCDDLIGGHIWMSEQHDVRLNGIQIDVQRLRIIRNDLGKAARLRIVLDHSLSIITQRIQRPCCDDTRLPHSSTPDLSHAPSFFNILFASAKRASDW